MSYCFSWWSVCDGNMARLLLEINIFPPFQFHENKGEMVDVVWFECIKNWKWKSRLHIYPLIFLYCFSSLHNQIFKWGYNGLFMPISRCRELDTHLQEKEWMRESKPTQNFGPRIEESICTHKLWNQTKYIPFPAGIAIFSPQICEPNKSQVFHQYLCFSYNMYWIFSWFFLDQVPYL